MAHSSPADGKPACGAVDLAAHVPRRPARSPKRRVRRSKSARESAREPPLQRAETVERELEELRIRVRAVCRQVLRAERRRPNTAVEAASKPLAELLEAAQRAKLEALEYTSYSRAELVDHLKRLIGVLDEARSECEAKDQEIVRLESELQLEREYRSSLASQLLLERDHFANVIALDRKEYSRKLQKCFEACSWQVAEDPGASEPPDAQRLVELKLELEKAYHSRDEQLRSVFQGGEENVAQLDLVDVAKVEDCASRNVSAEAQAANLLASCEVGSRSAFSWKEALEPKQRQTGGTQNASNDREAGVDSSEEVDCQIQLLARQVSVSRHLELQQTRVARQDEQPALELTSAESRLQNLSGPCRPDIGDDAHLDDAFGAESGAKDSLPEAIKPARDDGVANSRAPVSELPVTSSTSHLEEQSCQWAVTADPTSTDLPTVTGPVAKCAEHAAKAEYRPDQSNAAAANAEKVCAGEEELGDASVPAETSSQRGSDDLEGARSGGLSAEAETPAAIGTSGEGAAHTGNIETPVDPSGVDAAADVARAEAAAARVVVGGAAYGVAEADDEAVEAEVAKEAAEEDVVEEAAEEDGEKVVAEKLAEEAAEEAAEEEVEEEAKEAVEGEAKEAAEDVAVTGTAADATAGMPLAGHGTVEEHGTPAGTAHAFGTKAAQLDHHAAWHRDQDSSREHPTSATDRAPATDLLAASSESPLAQDGSGAGEGPHLSDTVSSGTGGAHPPAKVDVRDDVHPGADTHFAAMAAGASSEPSPAASRDDRADAMELVPSSPYGANRLALTSSLISDGERPRPRHQVSFGEVDFPRVFSASDDSDTAAAAAPALPPGWTVQWSASKGREYYFHEESGRSVWRIEDTARPPRRRRPQ